MATYKYRLLNVFAIPGQRLSGNPLCVFEDGRGLDTQAMQALALQFNLSETTFLLPSERANAQVRIFTPTFEMPFAGHPTLGTAHVLRALQGGNELTLEMKAGVIPVRAAGNDWTLRANTPTSRSANVRREDFAQMLGLSLTDVGAHALWVNAGSEQLVVPLTSVAAVDRCRPVPELLVKYALRAPGEFLVYVWAEDEVGGVRARFFFSKDSAVIEDPATGSACANLGGWLVASGRELPLSYRVLQGEHVGRPSQLHLHVDNERRIHVSGHVIELGAGQISI